MISVTMRKQTQSILTVIALLFLAIIGLQFLFNTVLPSQESIQSYFENAGAWGLVAYFLFGTTAVFIVPLNFSLTGIAGGFVYGTWIAFLINWACKIVGTFIAFMIGKYFGKKLIPFLKRNGYNTYDHIMESERLIFAYFILNFIPFTPSDGMAYFLGFSKMKARVFIPISALSSTGTAFTLAYIGSGEALSNPLFLVGLGLVLSLGLTWLHQRKRAYKLGA